MHKILWVGIGVMLVLVVNQSLCASAADPASALPVYVTSQDCSRLVAHHPDPSVTYQPGADVHGRFVAPADLPENNALKILPDKLTFDLKVNPLTYGGAAGAADSRHFGNSAASIAKIEIDLLSGAAKLNGKPLEDEQSRIVLAACRQAGYR